MTLAATTRAVEDIRVGRHRIRVSIAGRGHPLLLVMGLGGNIEMWAPLERELVARGFETIAYDAPGTGASSRPGVPLRMPGIADLAARLLDTLGYRTVDVLGVSFGGALAQELAHRRPTRVRRLVLAATSAGLGSRPGSLRALAILATPLRYYSPTYLRRVAPTLYGGRVAREPRLLREFERARMSRPPSLAGYAAQLYAASGWSSLPWLHRLTQPTLVLAGDDDPIIPVVNARQLVHRLPNARLEVFAGGGHLFLLEASTHAAATIADFLTADVNSREGSCPPPPLLPPRAASTGSSSSSPMTTAPSSGACATS
ncbi:MAG: alpha/beta fold hydrolase [Acidimicrobiales bacterium]